MLRGRTRPVGSTTCSSRSVARPRRPRCGRPCRRRRGARRLRQPPLVARLTVAAVAAATVIAGLVLWWPDDVDAVPSPVATTTRRSPAPVVTTVPLVEASPELLPPPDPSPESTTAAAPEPAPQPMPQPQPSPAPSSKPDARGTPTPVERAPMSVSPPTAGCIPQSAPARQRQWAASRRPAGATGVVTGGQENMNPLMNRVILRR